MALKGIKVIEMMGLAPGPFCGTILADFGASVTVVQKLNPSPVDVMSNGKRRLSVNLKSKEGVQVLKKLCKSADVLLDIYRPGILEKLGLGPELLLRENPRLIYARLTGYGQNGYYKDKAGHDINYVAMSGILSMLVKDSQPPKPPLNLLADFAGGSVLCTLGILIALLERANSGKGQVIDASMTEGAAYVASWLFKSRNLSIWSGEPGTNILDGGLPCYGVYKTKDGKFMAVGALEPQFYSNFLKGLELSEDIYTQFDKDLCEKKFNEVFLTKTQDEWCTIFENLDACVTPVLDISNVSHHECNLSRQSFYTNDENLVLPEPAPKLSLTPAVASAKKESSKPGQHTIEILEELGYSRSEIQELINKKCIYAIPKSNL